MVIIISSKYTIFRFIIRIFFSFSYSMYCNKMTENNRILKKSIETCWYQKEFAQLILNTKFELFIRHPKKKPVKNRYFINKDLMLIEQVCFFFAISNELSLFYVIIWFSGLITFVFRFQLPSVLMSTFNIQTANFVHYLFQICLLENK